MNFLSIRVNLCRFTLSKNLSERGGGRRSCDGDICYGDGGGGGLGMGTLQLMLIFMLPENVCAVQFTKGNFHVLIYSF